MSRVNLLFYISGHGFGHVSRSMETVSRILAKKEDWSATIVSERAEEFTRTLDPNSVWGKIKDRVKFRKGSPDVGIVQKDSLGMDLEATVLSIETFRNNRDRFLEAEEEEIRKNLPNLLFSDSGSLPFVLSDRFKIPSFFLGSFTWDFIYSHYENDIFQTFETEMKKEYSLCNFGFILPLSCPVTSISNAKDIGLIGRRPNLSKDEARRYFGMEDGVEYYLFSFGAYGIDSSRFDWKSWNPQKKRIVVGGLEWKVPSEYSLGILNVGNCHYPDLLRACDYVLTKPGYGILSEAYYAGTPILYTDRGNFPEYEYLVGELRSKFRSCYLSQDELYAFKWENASRTALDKLPQTDDRLSRDGVTDILTRLESILS
ncbi:glycosyl transferase [Leptospira wolffii]|uniref:glycosyl transferase n=1 Tax=Leptospira wolffii TaxID=409998 RepID=UPI001083C5F3|nr:glycosyl transferase [Leptospira wolffii]TGK56173.1 glycosyl transferase [Leptospira wolffii]TGK72219.1 glycosyl transferase [Leptospira wolffii]TGK72874.1 glycosyl transferase [Leptospira wolffii]TGL27796.1 glycosyl transferase [Leptospira wolffii]